MRKSDLIEALAREYPLMTQAQAEQAVEVMFGGISEALRKGQHVEIRGFGSFRLRLRRAKTGRNPETGADVSIPEKKVLHWRMGKDFRALMNNDTPPPSSPDPNAA